MSGVQGKEIAVEDPAVEIENITGDEEEKDENRPGDLGFAIKVEEALENSRPLTNISEERLVKEIQIQYRTNSVLG